MRPNGVDKGSVARRILNRHNSDTAAPLDFVLVLGDDVADEAMFGMVQNIMEQNQQQIRQTMPVPAAQEGLLETTSAAGGGKAHSAGGKINSGGVSGMSPHDPSQYAYVDDYRRQYRSFRKGNAKGAKGETSQVFSQLVGGGQRFCPPAVAASIGDGGLVGAAGAAAGAAAAVFTVTVGRKPSEASFYYDTPDDVVELLASMAKASVMWGQESKQQRSMSLSDLSQYAYRHASVGGDAGRAAGGVGVEFGSKDVFQSRALSLDGPASNPVSPVKRDMARLDLGGGGGSGGGGAVVGGDDNLDNAGGVASGCDGSGGSGGGGGGGGKLLDGSSGMDPTGALGGLGNGSSGSGRRTREQVREDEREQLRADTQKTRLAGSNSLLNIAKLAAEGSLTDAASVEALVQAPIAPIPTMEDFLDFGAVDEDEANFF